MHPEYSSDWELFNILRGSLPNSIVETNFWRQKPRHLDYLGHRIDNPMETRVLTQWVGFWFKFVLLDWFCVNLWLPEIIPLFLGLGGTPCLCEKDWCFIEAGVYKPRIVFHPASAELGQRFGFGSGKGKEKGRKEKEAKGQGTGEGDRETER